MCRLSFFLNFNGRFVALFEFYVEPEHYAVSDFFKFLQPKWVICRLYCSKLK